MHIISHTVIINKNIIIWYISFYSFVERMLNWRLEFGFGFGFEHWANEVHTPRAPFILREHWLHSLPPQLNMIMIIMLFIFMKIIILFICLCMFCADILGIGLNAIGKMRWECIGICAVKWNVNSWFWLDGRSFVIFTSDSVIMFVFFTVVGRGHLILIADIRVQRKSKHSKAFALLLVYMEHTKRAIQYISVYIE